MLASGLAHAQTPDSSEPFTSGAAGRTTLGSTPLRIWHRTEGFGQEASETAFGGRAAVDLAGAVGFMDGQFRISNESRFGTNIGGGVRWYADDFLTGAPRILGVTGWYDGQETFLDNYFNQAGVSFESLGEFIDLRLNANLPFEDQKSGDMSFVTGGLSFAGNSLSQITLTPTDVSLRVVDFEAAARVLDLNAWVYGGGYQMDGNGISEAGAKAGVRGYLTNDLAVDVGVTDDEVFGTNTVFQIIWTPGRTGAGPTSWIHTLADRMREPVYRNTYIATDQVQFEGSMALTDGTGDALNIVHVDSSAAEGGDGTFERPFNDLAEVTLNTQQGDIILAHHDSVFTGQSVSLKDSQRFLGEGDRNGDGLREQQLITTSQLGTIAIPATSTAADTGAIPLIQNAAASAIILAGGNDEVSTLAEIEVSNFRITGGVNAITSPGGVGDVNINRLDIANTTGNAIQLTALTETLANNNTQSRFTPTIDDVTFTGVDLDDINIDATTAQATIVETVTISDITSDNGDGVGINLIGLNRAATITNFDWDGDNTSVAGSGIGALRIANSGTQGNVTLNGTNNITGGIEGVALGAQGYAILLENNSGDLTATGTTITNMGGDSVIVDGGSGDLNFTGRIVQTENAASVLSVDGHTGALTFTERVANQGVVQATIGDGLQFNDADGAYTFNDEVELIGTSNAVNVTGGEGAITFLNAEFTNTTADTLTFNGGEMAMTLTGRILQNNNFAVLSVSNGHDGRLEFNELTNNAGVIEANNGTGLVFANADGAYVFNDEVDLSGGNAHIDITEGNDAVNGSQGTFTFENGDIVNPSAGPAVRIDGSNVIFNYAGNIDSTNADAVVINGNSGGDVTFASGSTIDTTFGIEVTNNAAGTYEFAGQVTITGVNENGVEILNNTGGSTTFNNIDITKTGTGTGFVANSAAPGHAVTVTGATNTIATDTGVALNLDTIAVGGAGINFQSVSSDGAASGIIIDNVTGGLVNIGTVGSAIGASGTIANSTGAAGVIINNAANVALNGLTVDGTTAAGADGIQITHTNAAQSVVRINNARITDTIGSGIEYNRSASATSRFTLTGSDIDNNGDTSVLMAINGTGIQDITINQGNQISNTAGDSALAITTGGGAKTTSILIDSNFFDNDAAAATVNLVSGSAGTMNTIVTSNPSIINAGAGAAYAQTSNVGAVRLNLNGNTATAGAAQEYILTENGGSTFTVVDLADVDTNNAGDTADPVSTSAGIADEPNAVPPPQP
jgi:hypothetical protein